MSRTLEAKIIAVTGGLGVLGRAIGQVLAQHGARVALLDKAHASGVEIDGVLSIGGVDLTDAKATAAALERVVTHFGALDGLVNVAGGFRWEKIEGGSMETWDLMFDMNLRTAVLASMAALPHLLAHSAGRIVNVGALAAAQAGVGMGAYAASKAGVARFTETMAEEFKDHELTVNAVLPSIIDTPSNRADMPEADFSRWVAPSSLADVVAFLLSPAAASISGALIPVKGRM